MFGGQLIQILKRVKNNVTRIYLSLNTAFHYYGNNSKLNFKYIRQEFMLSEQFIIVIPILYKLGTQIIT